MFLELTKGNEFHKLDSDKNLTEKPGLGTESFGQGVLPFNTYCKS